LLRSTEILRHRYGRINVQFGLPLTLGEMRNELRISPDVELATAKRRAVVTRLANRVMDEINHVTAVTPGALTALALLSDRRRSVGHEELLERCQKLLGLLVSMGARVTTPAVSDGALRTEAIREAVQMYAEAELLEAYVPGDSVVPAERRGHRTGAGMLYRVPERKRLELDTSKNHIVHFFVERGMIALSVLYRPGPPVPLAAVRERVQAISKLFKHEFRFRVDPSFEAIFEQTLAAMIARGELRHTAGDALEPGAGCDGWPAEVWLRTYASIIRNFLESYRVAARGLTLLLKGPMTEKDFLKRTLILGDRMYLSSEIELREAVSKPLFANALTAFREEGYLRLREGKYALTESFASSEAVATIEGRIAGFCSSFEP
jgi:glycerol-3-phosphate O-acyltransferase